MEVANPSSATTEAVLRQLTASMSLNNQTNMEMNELCRLEFTRLHKKYELKKNRLKKIHKSVMNLIINASATQGMIDNQMELITPSGPVQSCVDFFLSKTTGLVENELYNQFKAIGMADVDFAHGTGQALLAGQFQYNVGGSPSNLSGSCFCKKIPSRSG